MNGFGVVEVVDYLRLGEMVVEWAKGSQYVPRTVEEFRVQCIQRNVDLRLPGRITKVQFAQPENDTLMIRLPARDAINSARDHALQLGSSTDYPLPHFYADIVAGKLRFPKALDCRVADLAISNF